MAQRSRWLVRSRLASHCLVVGDPRSSDVRRCVALFSARNEFFLPLQDVLQKRTGYLIWLDQRFGWEGVSDCRQQMCNVRLVHLFESGCFPDSLQCFFLGDKLLTAGSVSKPEVAMSRVAMLAHDDTSPFLLGHSREPPFFLGLAVRVWKCIQHNTYVTEPTLRFQLCFTLG